MIDLMPLSQQLTNFASSANFWTDFELIFGTEYNATIAESIRNQWLNGDFSNLPTIEIISSDILGNAKGGYGSSNNTIYLSDSFVANASEEQIIAVLLEEIGHYIDAQVNITDTVGDEGELFSAIVRGVNLSETELTLIATENDNKTIILDGQEITIETAAGLIIINANSISESTNTPISINKTGTTGTDENIGVWIDLDGFIESTGTGTDAATITVVGNGATDSTGQANYGILIQNTPNNSVNSRITSVDGAIDLTGNGGGGTNFNTGFVLANKGQISSTGTASIKITGKGSTSASGNNNQGISIETGGKITSTSSSIELIGTGGKGTNNNHGIRLLPGALISAGGSGNITITANENINSTEGTNFGFLAIDSTVTSLNGLINIKGTGGTGANNNIGIYVNNTSISSTGTSDGHITLTGYGSPQASGQQNYGVFIDTNGKITTTIGNISITGNGGKGTNFNHGVLLNTGSLISSGGSGKIDIVANGNTDSTGGTTFGFGAIKSTITSVDGSIL